MVSTIEITGHDGMHGSRRDAECGSPSSVPTLATAIGLGYVGVEDGATGTHLEVEVRDVMVAVEVVDLPFYKKKPPQGGPKEAR